MSVAWPLAVTDSPKTVALTWDLEQFISIFKTSVATDNNMITLIELAVNIGPLVGVEPDARHT